MNITINEEIIHNPIEYSAPYIILSTYVVMGRMNNDINHFLLGSTCMYIYFALHN